MTKHFTTKEFNNLPVEKVLVWVNSMNVSIVRRAGEVLVSFH